MALTEFGTVKSPVGGTPESAKRALAEAQRRDATGAPQCVFVHRRHSLVVFSNCKRLHVRTFQKHTFAIRKEDKSFVDVIIRAVDAADAKALIVKSEELCEFVGIPPDIATEMGLSEARGRYEGAVSKWIIGPEIV